MSRTITSAVLQRLMNDQLSVFHLLELHLSSTSYYLTDAYRTVNWNGNDYTALGHLLQFDGIEETSTVQVNDTAVSLSGVDQTIIAAFLSEDYINRQAKIFLGLFEDLYAEGDPVSTDRILQEDLTSFVLQEDGSSKVQQETGVIVPPSESSTQIVVDPILMIDGLMDNPFVDDDPDSGKSIIGVTIVNHWADARRVNGRISNHETQQIYFPGDKGFQFASELQKELTWGKLT